MSKNFVQPVVFRVFTKIGMADTVSDALEGVDVYADTIKNGNVAKLIFMAPSVDHVRAALKASGILTCEMFDVNTANWDSQSADKEFVKVTL